MGKDLDPILRFTLLGFAGLAFVAFLLLGIGAEDTEDWFSWTIEPPLSAAALASFYGPALALFVSGVTAPGPVTVRQIAPTVLIIATTLLIVTLIHLDRFHMDSLFGVFWLCAYIVAPPLLLAGTLRERRSGQSIQGSRLPPVLRWLLAAEGVVMLGIAALLLVAPESAADVWPWALTPLVARAFGAFTLGVGVLAAIISWDGEVGAPGIVVAYAALGAFQLLAVALHSGDLGDDSTATTIYVAFLGLVLATGLYGLWSASRSLTRA